jgi:hypothetical protein
MKKGICEFTDGHMTPFHTLMVNFSQFFPDPLRIIFSASYPLCSPVYKILRGMAVWKPAEKGNDLSGPIFGDK